MSHGSLGIAGVDGQDQKARVWLKTLQHMGERRLKALPFSCVRALGQQLVMCIMGTVWSPRVTATKAEILLPLEPMSVISSYGPWSPGNKDRLPSLFT